MTTWTKERPSRLAPFEETLFAMDAAKNTLAEMQQWLSGHGVTVSCQGISQFLISRRKRRWQRETLAQIAAGREPIGQAKTAFQTDPEPDLDTLIKLSRVMIFEHAAHLDVGPRSTGMAVQIDKMVQTYITRHAKLESQKTEFALAARRLALREASARRKQEMAAGPRAQPVSTEFTPDQTPKTKHFL
jgi:hypothetical protein